MKRTILFISTILFLCMNLYAQDFMKEKRIYLVDVTASMIGKGGVKTPDIFNKVKDQLTTAISNIQDADTEIVVIPFTNTTHQAIYGTSTKKDSLLAEINKISIKNGDTNIVDAWLSGISELDSARVNYLFLLTDGLHNCGHSKEELYNNLNNWPQIAKGKYYFAFYVMLTPNAKEQEIYQIIDKNDQMWLIESTNVNATFIKSYMNIQSNIFEKKTVKMPMFINNRNSNITFNIELDENEYYKISNLRTHLDEGYVLFDIVELKPHADMPIEVQTRLHITYDKEKYDLTFFTPEVINFKIVNRGIREMNIILTK